MLELSRSKSTLFPVILWTYFPCPQVTGPLGLRCFVGLLKVRVRHDYPCIGDLLLTYGQCDLSTRCVKDQTKELSSNTLAFICSPIFLSTTIYSPSCPPPSFVAINHPFESPHKIGHLRHSFGFRHMKAISKPFVHRWRCVDEGVDDRRRRSAV
jgi:hypothetical protein